MTSIKLIVNGATARAEVDGLLTSGMVGIPVTIEYDSDWDGLTKALVCKAAGSRADGAGVVKAILNVENEATVAPEVMIAKKFLYLGVEGRNAQGTLVIPTIWALCGRIQPSADVDDDPSTDPTLPVWAQLEQRIDNLEQNGGGGGSDSSQNVDRTSEIKSILTDIVMFLKAVPFDDTVVSASDLDDIQTKIDALTQSGDDIGGGDDTGGSTTETVTATFADGVLEISGVTVNSATFSDGVLAVV